jgi:hypothetical protein
MPIKPENRHLYGAEWRKVRKEILERAGNRCEWMIYDSSERQYRRCSAPNHELVFRDLNNHEIWKKKRGIYPPHHTYPVKIVLTVEHTNHDPTDNHPENLLALCQLHHLRLDAEQHRRNSSETRARRMEEAAQKIGQQSLVTKEEDEIKAENKDSVVSRSST